MSEVILANLSPKDPQLVKLSEGNGSSSSSVDLLRGQSSGIVPLMSPKMCPSWSLISNSWISSLRREGTTPLQEETTGKLGKVKVWT